MSDTERSPARPRIQRSRSRSYSKSPVRKRSGSRSPIRRRSYSRSPSPRRKRHSRSRSRSPYRRRSPYRKRSRSPYRSYGRSYRRSPSRSPYSRRRRHFGDREDPAPSHCIGVFGLSLTTTERDIEQVFDKFGPMDQVKIVYDRQSGRSRGFGFVYYKTVEDAMEAKERCNGLEVDGRRIRVDYSITERPHTPTPGVYLGKPTVRSPSPYGRGYSRRYRGVSRDRSRSRSPSYRRY